jgi:hypothetical protein
MGVREIRELGRGGIPICRGGPQDDAQLGILPVPVSDVLSVSCYVGAGSNGYEGCAVKRDGAVVCWNELIAPGPTPVAVPNVKDAVQVATSIGTSCAITRDHHLLCWGQNNQGQLGIGTTTPTAPSAVVEPVLTR